MKKLSKAQERALERAKEKIDKARSQTLEQYISESGVRVGGIFPYEWFKERYNKARNGIVCVNSTLPTLKKLEELGLIEIVDIDEYRSCGRVGDNIKVLNY